MVEKKSARRKPVNRKRKTTKKGNKVKVSVVADDIKTKAIVPEMSDVDLMPDTIDVNQDSSVHRGDFMQENSPLVEDNSTRVSDESVIEQQTMVEKFDFLLEELRKFLKVSPYCRLRNLRIVENRRARLEYYVMRGSTKYATLRPGRAHHVVYQSGFRTVLLREPKLREFFRG